MRLSSPKFSGQAGRLGTQRRVPVAASEFEGNLLAEFPVSGNVNLLLKALKPLLKAHPH